MKIKQDEKTKIVLTHESLAKEVQIISMKQMKNAVSKGVVGYYLFPMATSDTQPISANEELKAILQEYVDVFEEPHGLPPERNYDHSILLVDGAETPRVRPYRVPQ